MADDSVHLDDAEVFELLNSEDDVVGGLLEELSERAATVARMRVRVRHTRGGGSGFTSTARAPGATLASINVKVYRDAEGYIYAGVRADESATIFLEEPAKQMHEAYPFLTTGLDSLEL